MQASAVFSRKADFLLVTIGCTKNFHVSISFLLIYLFYVRFITNNPICFLIINLAFSQIGNNQTHIEETSVQTEESFDSCIVMVQTALEAGMNDHVAKPIDMKVLMNVLEEQICGRKGS